MSTATLTSRVATALELPPSQLRGLALGALLGMLGVLVVRLTSPGRPTALAVIGLAARLTLVGALLTAGVLAGGYIDARVEARVEARLAEPYPIAYRLPPPFDPRNTRSTRESYSAASYDGRASFHSISWTWQESPWPTLDAAATELSQKLGEAELRSCTLNGHPAWVYRTDWFPVVAPQDASRTFVALIHTPTHLHRVTGTLPPDPKPQLGDPLLDPLLSFDAPRGGASGLRCERRSVLPLPPDPS